MAECYTRPIQPVAEPGTWFTYSDHNLNIVGLAIAQAVDEPFEDVVQKRLFAPLGMTHSSMKHPRLDNPKLARGHERHRGQDRRAIYLPIPHYAASGAAVSTLDDMIRFALAVLNGPVALGLRPDTYATMAAPGFLLAERTPVVGLGWLMAERCSALTLEHGGVIDGYRAKILLQHPRARV